jgi:dipeptidyl aminopeptidase/acylaminoacyl peptidase
MRVLGGQMRTVGIFVSFAFALWTSVVGFAQTMTATPVGTVTDRNSDAIPSASGFPTNEQMRHFRAMSAPRLSPDGKHVLIQIVDTAADGAKGHLWLADIEGGTVRQLTYSPDSDKRGEQAGDWMPDGQSILFLAKRGEHTSLYRLPINGGEARAFDLKVKPPVDESDLPGAIPPNKDDPKDSKEDKAEPVVIDVLSFRVSPDGKTIALIANDPQTAGEKKQKDTKADAKWVNHDLHGLKLYLVDVASNKLIVAGIPIDVRGVSWSADSTRLVVVREEPNGVSELGPAHSAWVVMLSDTSNATKLQNLPATVETAVWTADGGSIVYLAQAKREAPPDYFDLFEYTLGAKSTRNLTDGFGGSLELMEPLVLKDGGVLVIAEEGESSRVMRYGQGSDKPDPVKLPVSAISTVVTNAARNGWVFLGSSGGTPTELLYEATLGDVPKVIATPSLAPDGVKSAAPKRISWRSDHLTIEGMLYLPPETTTHKVPLVVEVHGGPLGAYLDSYSIFTDFLLGHGWAVLRTNPRGSTGRGAEFAAANRNDLGGGDFRDIMAGVDFVLRTEPIDPEKLALTGYSYGGEMAGFAEIKTTRFKAIVSMAPVIDQNSEYGTERDSWFDQWFYGKPWEHQADAWRQSPLSGVAQAKTPFLLLQGENDTSDPLGQAQEMYHALRQMRVPVELVTYPREEHSTLGMAIYGDPTDEPWHGFDARQRIVTFISKAFGEAKSGD